MPIINNLEETEKFISNKLIGAQLDMFCVYSIDLQLNFLAEVEGDLQDVWLSMTGRVHLYSAKKQINKRSEIIARLHSLLGQRVSFVKIEKEGFLSIHFTDGILTTGMDNDNLEIVWSLTPKSSDIYQQNEWSVILTDEADLILNK